MYVNKRWFSTGKAGVIALQAIQRMAALVRAHMEHLLTCCQHNSCVLVHLQPFIRTHTCSIASASGAQEEGSYGYIHHRAGKVLARQSEAQKKVFGGSRHPALDSKDLRSSEVVNTQYLLVFSEVPV